MVVTFIIVGGFILFDVVSGILKAFATTGLNSTALRQGLYHKLSELLAVAGSALLEYACAYIQLGIDLPLLGIVSVYVCTMEIISILENLSTVNPQLAELFKPYLEKLKMKDGENDAHKFD